MGKFTKITIIVSIIVIIIFIIVLINIGNKSEVKNENNKTVNTTSNNSSAVSSIKNNDNSAIEIDKDDNGNAIINSEGITSNATFYTYTFNDNVKVRLFAVKSSDGVIRTAFNTCQVCNPSPKAYFLQNGDSFICQNCGNKFASNKIGIEKGGCNPIPITDENKTVQDNKIVISTEIIDKYKSNFNN